MVFFSKNIHFLFAVIEEHNSDFKKLKMSNFACIGIGRSIKESVASVWWNTFMTNITSTPKKAGDMGNCQNVL